MRARRDRDAGLVPCQLRVRPDTAERLRRAVAVPGFEAALALCERNWRFVDEAALEPHERELIARLVREHGNGILHGRAAHLHQ